MPEDRSKTRHLICGQLLEKRIKLPPLMLLFIIALPFLGVSFINIIRDYHDKTQIKQS